MSLLFDQSVMDLLTDEVKEWATTLTARNLSDILLVAYNTPSAISELPANDPPSNIPNIPTACRNTVEQYAANIGKQGELQFADICSKLPDNYQITDTSKQGKSGDFLITYSYGRIKKTCLVDIKNYTSTVPKKELDKFYTDITFGGYDAGLLISCRSKIVSYRDSICLEQRDMSYGSIPIMYLSNVPEEFYIHAIKLLMYKTETRNLTASLIDMKIESMLSYINSSLSQSSMTRRTLSELNNTVSSTIIKCQENLLSLEIQIKQVVCEFARMIDDRPISTDCDTESVDTPPKFNLSLFRDKDKSLAVHLQLLPWIIIDPDNLILENNLITIRLLPLKTKTNIILQKYSDTDALADIRKLFSKRLGRLTAELTQEFIDTLALIQV